MLTWLDLTWGLDKQVYSHTLVYTKPPILLITIHHPGVAKVPSGCATPAKTTNMMKSRLSQNHKVLKFMKEIQVNHWATCHAQVRADRVQQKFKRVFSQPHIFSSRNSLVLPRFVCDHCWYYCKIVTRNALFSNGSLDIIFS